MEQGRVYKEYKLMHSMMWYTWFAKVFFTFKLFYVDIVQA
jgi:hypothetical protein